MKYSIIITAFSLLLALQISGQPCNVPFQAIVQSPICSGKDIQISSTTIPGASYSWTTAVTPSPTLIPSANIRAPKIQNISIAQSGVYTVTATIGPCVYTASVRVDVNITPSVGNVLQSGPVCPGENDTLSLPSISVPTGGIAHIIGPIGSDIFNSNGYYYEFKAVQKSAQGIYTIYAETPSGCFSDTVLYDFRVNPDIEAAFDFDINESCDLDSVVFTNLSKSDSNLSYASSWSFGDTKSQFFPDTLYKSTLHEYVVPKPNYDERNYKVVLIVDNGKCKDTLERNVYINHPVKAKFTNDKDSICQGTSISFNAGDSSYVKPATIPKMLWKYGDGYTDTVFNTTHQYDVAGIYRARFVMTDFLNCADSYDVEIVVDSAGFVYFESDKDQVCLGEEITFTGNYSAYAYKSAIWNFADGVTISDSLKVPRSYKEPGTYKVKFDIDYRICPDVTYERDIVIKPIPVLYLGPDTAICPNGEPVTLGDLLSSHDPKVKYSWNTSTKDITSVITVRHPGVYAVKADLDGCTASDTIVVSKNCYINIPNAFTPNGDGVSDYFLPRQLLSKELSGFNMNIYNRWGQLIYQSQGNTGRGWDGKFNGEDQPAGVYVYTIDATFGNGTTERYQGNVSLLR